MPKGKRPKRRNPKAERLTFIAELEQCLECEQPLSSVGSAAHATKTVQTLKGEYYVVAYSRRCETKGCGAYGKHYHAIGHLKVSLPYSTYGLDVVAYVGIKHEREHKQFREIAGELKEAGVEINSGSVGRVYRLFQALVTGAWPRRQEKLAKAEEEQGGLILLVDGLEPDKNGPGLYVVWEALSGTPISGVLMDVADKKHIVEWLEKCKEMLGEMKVVGTMSDKEDAVKQGLEEVWPEARNGLCQLHFVNNLAKPVVKDDQALKKELSQNVGKLPGIPKLSAAEAEGRVGLEKHPETRSEFDEGVETPLKRTGTAGTKPHPEGGRSDEGPASLSLSQTKGALSPTPLGQTTVIEGQVKLKEEQPLGANEAICGAEREAYQEQWPVNLGADETPFLLEWSTKGAFDGETEPEQNTTTVATLVKPVVRTDLASLTWLAAPELPPCIEQNEACPTAPDRELEGIDASPTTDISPLTALESVSNSKPVSAFSTETVKPPPSYRDNLLFPQVSPPDGLDAPFCSPPNSVELLQRYYGYYRQGIRDALSRTSRKPFAYGGLCGYDQLLGIHQALLNRHQQYGPDPYLDALQQRLQVALGATTSRAEAIRQAKEWLIKVERCLAQTSDTQASAPTSQSVKNELKQTFVALEQVAEAGSTSHSLLDKWLKMRQTWLPGILHCYDEPNLPRNNIQLESLFGQMRRHQRRVSGRKETSDLRIFGPGLLMTLTLDEDEILPWLESIPVKTYWLQRRKQEEREEPRRWLGRLRRDPVKAYSQVDDQFYAAIKEHFRASPDLDS